MAHLYVVTRANGKQILATETQRRREEISNNQHPTTNTQMKNTQHPMSKWLLSTWILDIACCLLDISCLSSIFSASLCLCGGLFFSPCVSASVLRPQLGRDLVWDLEVGEDVLHVFVVFEVSSAFKDYVWISATSCKGV